VYPNQGYYDIFLNGYPVQSAPLYSTSATPHLKFGDFWTGPSDSSYGSIFIDMVKVEGIAPPCKPGDVNMDGIVNSSDIQALANYLYYHGTLVNECSADVNEDGTVNSMDIVTLAAMLWSKTTLSRKPSLRIQRSHFQKIH